MPLINEPTYQSRRKEIIQNKLGKALSHSAHKTGTIDEDVLNKTITFLFSDNTMRIENLEYTYGDGHTTGTCDLKFHFYFDIFVQRREDAPDLIYTTFEEE